MDVTGRRLDEDGQSLLYQETRSSTNEDGEREFTRTGEPVYGDSPATTTTTNLYSESRAELDEDGERIFTEPMDEVYNDSNLYDESIGERTEDEERQVQEPVDPVYDDPFLGALDLDEICTANSMCASTCCQEPYSRRRVLDDDILYAETHQNQDQETREITPPVNPLGEDTYDENLYAETRTDPDEEEQTLTATSEPVYNDDDREFIEPSDPVYGSSS